MLRTYKVVKNLINQLVPGETCSKIRLYTYHQRQNA